MKPFRTILATAALLLAISSASAQLTKSPYSRYGYGMLTDNATSAQRGMGSVGYAMHSGRQINVMNPASFANVDSLTFLFDLGGDMSMMWSKEGDRSGRDIGGGLDYATMLFPVSKRVGVSIGLLPYSSVGYSFGSTIENGSSERTGSGGLNQAYLGAGVKLFKGMTLGASVGYLFGTTVNDLYVNTDAGSTTLFERVLKVRDYHLQFGAQYSYQLSERNRLSAGISFSPAKSLMGHTYGAYYDKGSDKEPDRVGYTRLKGKYSLPSSWGVGVAYMSTDRLLVEMDFTYQPWGSAKYSRLQSFEDTKLDDRYKIALGAQYTPRPRGNYFRRIQYRAGFYYNRDYLMVGGNHIREYGLSAGMGLPAAGSRTMINLGLEYKQRQATPNALVKENIFNITLGVNFNEMWFWRSKIR